MRFQPLSAALFVAVVMTACTEESAKRRLRDTFTAPAEGWIATSFAYREYDNNDDHTEWTLVSEVQYDGLTRWSFTDVPNPETAGTAYPLMEGQVEAPDGWATDLDWEIEPDQYTDELAMTLFLYEDAVLHQGLWIVTLPEVTAERMRWSIVGENVDRHRVEAELLLTPR